MNEHRIHDPFERMAQERVRQDMESGRKVLVLGVLVIFGLAALIGTALPFL
ncbi:MAG: hypothetical protein HN742_23670 [Lentisphaerae bacterium]|jgi:hypothetical protein|nr:hypothetical protein [Lentisphaerota bacterium]MBT5605227.1 hypothetical protein [Lentisphaerota bacterium]MBT7054321.1 hypothetical protein [Lentisphaerota bacterium]MBT7844895.1 hypothetical protein [Lentisphaerota bacterium]